MHKEEISVKQWISIFMLFIFGSSVVMGVSSEAAQDSWLSLLMAAVGSIPVILIYARIVRLNPGMDIFEMMEALLGKVGGKVGVALMAWYALHLGSMVLRNFSEFIQIASMPETPQLPIMIVMMVVTAYMSRSGVETLGRWSLGVIPLVLLVVAFTILLSLNKMDFTNLEPIMSHSFGQVAKASFSIFAFPFAETVLMLGAAGAIKKDDSPFKVYLGGMLLGALVLLVVLVRNIEMLGSAMMQAEYFPSYAAARVIDVGDYLSRIEITIAMNFILAGIVKISLCLIVATKGIARFFAIPDYRRLVMPTGLVMVALCATVYGSTMEMFAFLPIYQYYALPFQLVLPLIVWITAEVKARKQKKQAAVPAAGA
jgi:spore germination protein KB